MEVEFIFGMRILQSFVDVIRRFDGTDDRTEDDLLGVGCQDLVCERMANVFGKANEVSFCLVTGGGEAGLLSTLVVYLLPKFKTGKRADVGSDARQDLGWCAPSKGFDRHMVHDVAHIQHAEEPRKRRYSPSIHEVLYILLDGTPAPFTRVLMLVVWLAHPVVNGIRAEDVLGGLANFGFPTVTSNLIHGTTTTYVVL